MIFPVGIAYVHNPGTDILCSQRYCKIRESSACHISQYSVFIGDTKWQPAFEYSRLNDLNHYKLLFSIHSLVNTARSLSFITAEDSGLTWQTYLRGKLKYWDCLEVLYGNP